MATGEVPTVEQIRQLAVLVMEAAVASRARELAYQDEPGPEGTPQRTPPPAGGGNAADWVRLRAGYAWIPDLFVSAVGPEPAGFDGPISMAQALEKQLYDKGMSPVDRYHDLALSNLSDWTGDAATLFKTNFLSRLPEIVRNQAAVAFMLKHTMIAQKDVYVSNRTSLASIARVAKVAVEVAPECKGSPKAVAVLSVVAALATMAAGVASIPVTGGTSLAPAGVAAWTIIAGASSGAAVTVAGFEQPVETDLSAETVNGVLAKMTDAIVALQKDVDRKEREAVTALTDNLAQVNGAGFVAPRPALAGDVQDRTRIMTEFVPG